MLHLYRVQLVNFTSTSEKTLDASEKTLGGSEKTLGASVFSLVLVFFSLELAFSATIPSAAVHYSQR